MTLLKYQQGHDHWLSNVRHKTGKKRPHPGQSHSLFLSRNPERSPERTATFALTLAGINTRRILRDWKQSSNHAAFQYWQQKTSSDANKSTFSQNEDSRHLLRLFYKCTRLHLLAASQLVVSVCVMLRSIYPATSATDQHSYPGFQSFSLTLYGSGSSSTR